MTDEDLKRLDVTPEVLADALKQAPLAIEPWHSHRFAELAIARGSTR